MLPADVVPFPLPLNVYAHTEGAGVLTMLAERASQDPFNLVAAAIFVLAIVHTFAASRIMRLAHHVHERSHRERVKLGLPAGPSTAAEFLHFFGEVEVVFGLWAVVLASAATAWHGWPTAKTYLAHTVVYTEPLFVVVIMALASTRPVLTLAEQALRRIARVGGATPGAWWLTILTVGPLLGSLVTEPAAMTICALLLARQFYRHDPSMALRYATLGLLFVNVSLGGTLTHFAAPPVLMVARPWGWDTSFMLGAFGWRAIVVIVGATAAYWLTFRGEFRRVAAHRSEAPAADHLAASEKIPAWVTIGNLAFMAWTVANAHEPALFVGGFLFFLGFAKATAPFQRRLDLRPALLVGFFLGGLVIHGGLQGWWIQPVLGGLSRVPLFLGAVGLTAFNDNALITYLATLVPDLSETLKLAVVGGAVTGGGLTVIANAPNPAGQALLSSYFDQAVSPLYLLAGAIPATVLSAFVFLLLAP